MTDDGFSSLVQDVPKFDVTRACRVLTLFEGFKPHIQRLLDVGCHDGSLTLRIRNASNASEAYGLDQDEERLKLAEKKGVKTTRLDVDKDLYPFENDYFDAVFGGEVLEHLNDPDHFLEEVHRILKEKGLLVITTPNFASWYNRIALALAFQPFFLENSWRFANAGKIFDFEAEGGIKSVEVDGRHVKLYTRRALTELLELYGFHILQHTGYPYSLNGKRYFVFNFIDRLMDRFGAGTGLIISCSKN